MGRVIGCIKNDSTPQGRAAEHQIKCRSRGIVQRVNHSPPELTPPLNDQAGLKQSEMPKPPFW